MKNITKRNDGRWVGRKTINGKRYSVYANTKVECIIKYKAMIENPPKPKKEPKSTKPSFYEFANHWLEQYKKNKIGDKAYKIYLSTIKNHFSNMNEKIDKYTTQDLQDIINILPQTRIKEFCFTTMRQIFKKAKEIRLINFNPAEFIEKGKIERKEIEWFNPAEQKRIIENLKGKPFENKILCYLLTGARPEEICSIKKSTTKQDYTYIDGTKTKNAKRWIKISKRLYDLIQSEKEETPYKCDIKALQKTFRKFLNKIGIQGNMYKLRHTYATNLFYLGIPDKERQSYMGHYSSNLTNNIYTTFDPTIKREDITNIYGDWYPWQ